MTLADHVRATIRYWYILLVMLVLGAAIAVIAVALQPTMYKATARLAIGPAAGVTGEGTTAQITTALQNVAVPATLAEIAGSDATKHDAISAAGVSGAGVSITAIVANNSDVIELTVKTKHAADTVKVATALISGSTAQFTKVYPIAAVTAVQTPTSATKAKASTSTTTVLGGVLGLVLGYLIALGLATNAKQSTAGRRHRAAGEPYEPASQNGGGYPTDDMTSGGRLL